MTMSDTIDLQILEGCAVLTCVGDLDLHCADELRRAIGSATRSGALKIVVDVSGTDLVDSTTLGVLLHAKKACSDVGSTLVIAGAPRLVARSIALTGLDRVLTLAPDVASAIRLGEPEAARS